MTCAEHYIKHCNAQHGPAMALNMCGAGAKYGLVAQNVRAWRQEGVASCGSLSHLLDALCIHCHQVNCGVTLHTDCSSALSSWRMQL